MKRLSIFATYDKDNIVDDYVVYYLSKLSELSDIIYVSDCDIKEEELGKVKDYTIHIINGRHGEYDFGSYKRGFLYAKENNILENYDYLIFCNDSMYGPFYPLSPIIEEMEEKDPDAWGMYLYGTAEIAPHPKHLQSYFISMSSTIFLSDWFLDFIYSIKYLEDKEEIITRYEVGLGKLFFEHKLNIYYKFTDTKDMVSLPHNDPYSLIKSGFPFLKKMIIAHSKEFNFTLLKLFSILDKIKNSYNCSLILKNIDRTLSLEYFYTKNYTPPIESNKKVYFSLLKILGFSLFSIESFRGRLIIKLFGIKITLK